MNSLLILAVLMIAIYAYRAKKLTFSGAIAAVIVGSSIAIGFGLYGLFILGVFFFSSSVLSSVKLEQKRQEVTEKGEQRDAMQVIANGGIGALFSVIYLLFPSAILICGFVASLAAANSDTWASEIGSSSKQKPFHIVKWKRVARGTSGAVTIRGTLAAIAGSFLIAICSSFLWGVSLEQLIVLLLLLTLAGFIGNLFDTVIGATSQVVYRCKVCGLETERKEHCEQKTLIISGVKWINNDIVNLGCTIVGSLIGMMVGLLVL